MLLSVPKSYAGSPCEVMHRSHVVDNLRLSPQLHPAPFSLCLVSQEAVSMDDNNQVFAGHPAPV